MAAASPYPYLKQSPSYGIGLTLGLIGLVALGAAFGVLLAIGEVQALYVCLSVVAAIAVLFDFRFGVVLLVMLLTLSTSNLFPHELLGLRGLNPINLLILATFGSYLLHGRIAHRAPFVPQPLLWLYIVPFLVAGALGARHAHEVLPLFYETMAINFTDATGYLRDLVLKPALLVVFALLLAAAVAKSQKPERFIVPIAVAVWLMALLEIGFVVDSGVRLGQLAGGGLARAFFLQIGMHANDLGRLYAMAYALLLFTWWETKDTGLKVLLFFTLGIIGIALLLTFSRAAFLGFVVVNALFLVWKFNARSLGLALLGVVLLLALAPGALYDRITFGLQSGNIDTVSAGRINEIWLPLLPQIWKTPPWGSGVGSIMWSYPMLTGAMEPVIHPHNAYLQALLDTGVIGLVCFLAYYFLVWRGFRRLGSNAFLSPTLRGFFQGATAGLAAFFVTAWVGSSFMPTYEWSFLWMAIGMMYGLAARKPAS